MRLEDIGFYTLSDERARNVTFDSDLQRCELVLTDRCNFKCKYCRGIKEDCRGDLSFRDARNIIDCWASGNLKNVRFSGGEPTIWPGLDALIKYVKTKKSITRIALSTNGSASIADYEALLFAGVDDFSVSLDACCASTADRMAGVDVKFKHISNVIKFLSSETYCTVGVVLDEGNIRELDKIIDYSARLGVSDIRVIPSAQYNAALKFNLSTDYKILNYRLNNMKNGRHVRGLKDSDSAKCHLVKDDMVILNNKHFPCVIYMREKGPHIGIVKGKPLSVIREERRRWFEKTNCHDDVICKNNCLDVCIDHNNKVNEIRQED